MKRAGHRKRADLTAIEKTMTSITFLEAVRALDGCKFAMLTTKELTVLAFIRDQGRKYDVFVTILSDADPKALERTSRAQADEKHEAGK